MATSITPNTRKTIKLHFNWLPPYPGPTGSSPRQNRQNKVPSENKRKQKEIRLTVNNPE